MRLLIEHHVTRGTIKTIEEMKPITRSQSNAARLVVQILYSPLFPPLGFWSRDSQVLLSVVGFCWTYYGHHFEQGGDSSVMDDQLFNSRNPWMLGQCNPKCKISLTAAYGSVFHGNHHLCSILSHCSEIQFPLHSHAVNSGKVLALISWKRNTLQDD